MGNAVTLESGLEVTGATLLTAEEAERLPKETRAIGDWWWLRSPGNLSHYAASVHSDGSVNYDGNYVNTVLGAVRPALDIQNLKSSDLKIRDQFDFGDRKFEIISDTKALCTENIGYCAFQEDWKADDANDYETSDIKKFVDSWYQGIILQLSQKKEKIETGNQNNITLENGLEITGATLLTADEAGRLPKEMMVFPRWWWLRSPGMVFCTAYVSADGIVCRNGNDTSFSNGAVRPALKISNLESSGLSIGDYFRFGTEFGENEFKIISGTRALCTGSIGNCAFQTNQDVGDTRDYEISNIKKIVDEWYSKAIRNIRKEEICHTKIRQAAQYLRDCIPCRKTEPTCGFYTGCMECPYNQFRETVMTAFDVILHDSSAGKLFESYITENISDKSIRMQSQSILNRVNNSKENNRTDTTKKNKTETQNKVVLESGLEVTGATLLTAREAKKLPKKNRAIGCWWWLRSPGYGSLCAADVDSGGSVSYDGDNVCFNYGAVRPALEIQNLKSSDLKIRDQFDFGDRKFEIISDTKALCTESVGKCAFREDWETDNANDYEASDVKKFVDSWYRDIILQLSQKKKRSETENRNKIILENGLEIAGATLLTVEEAGKITKETLEISDNWWLRSRGIISHTVIVANSNGSIRYSGDYVFYNNAVRPALIIHPESSNLRIGDTFRFGEKDFEIISDTRAICTDIIGKSAFRENWKINMKDSDDYEASDVKKFVDSWYRNAVNEVSGTDTTKKERGGQKMDRKTNISVHDAIRATARCGKTEKEREKERLRECVENCIEITDRMILEEAEKGNEQITIVRDDLKNGIFHNDILYNTFIYADFQQDIIPALKKHYNKKHFRSCEITRPYPVHPAGIEIHWEKNPVKRFFSAHDFVIVPLL